MKLLTIILDASGVLHIQATRAPDLRRREISQTTGGAEILFCAVPPEERSAEQLVVALTATIGASRSIDRDRIRRLAIWHVHLKPSLQRVTRRIRKRLFPRFRFWRTASIPAPAR